ncbi:MAG: hypothetical protein A2X66_03445 [Ignavibacteria bacterium GWA2_54_16]|nr:MAG: hypothetical protein A2X66_03445 [Ignavibacteria bacterium GWA2_54_16]
MANPFSIVLGAIATNNRNDEAKFVYNPGQPPRFVSTPTPIHDFGTSFGNIVRPEGLLTPLVKLK